MNYECNPVCVCVYAEEVAGLQCMKRILGKVQEMREQRGSLEKQLRDLIQQDDITSTLVTTERANMKVRGCTWFPPHKHADWDLKKREMKAEMIHG